MHLSDGEIRAYLDQELYPERYPQVQAHLAACVRCRTRAEDLRTTADHVSQHMAPIQESTGRSPVAASTGHLRLEAALQINHKENPTMQNKLSSRRLRPLWAGLAVVATLAIAFSFPQVRAAANSFLGLFRVQQIAIVQFDPNQLSRDLESSSAQFEMMFSEDVKFEEVGQYLQVFSPAEASSVAGFNVRLPQSVEGDSTLEIQPGGRVSMVIDLPRVKSMLAAIGHEDIVLPDQLDGAEVELDLPVSVTALYGGCAAMKFAPEGQDPDQSYPTGPITCTTLTQLPSPTISAPEGLDLTQIGQAYLQLLGMSETDAAQFASSVDWTTTFVMPLPRNDAEYQQVTVDGVPGTLIMQDYGPEYQNYVLIWIKDGMLYGLTGDGGMADALEIANSLQ